VVKIKSHWLIILARLVAMEIEASLEQAMKSVMNSVEEINKKLDQVQTILNNLDARVAVTNNTAGKTLGETNQSVGYRLG
jgi:prefoldin subunit 5